MKTYIRPYLCVTIISLVFTCTGCREPDIPINEMTAAKAKISRAEKAEAEKYAPNELRAAKKKLKESHSLVVSREVEKAKTAATISELKALSAIKKAWIMKASKAIENAEKVLHEAEGLKAALYAKKEFKHAGETLEKSKKSFGENKHEEAYLLALSAEKAADAAKQKGLEARAGMSDSDKTVIVSSKTAGEKITKMQKVSGADTAAARVKKKPVIYYVKYDRRDRDCLWKIAERFYKNPFLWKKIYEANRDKIKNPHVLQPGLEIQIPVLEGVND